jgi:hypothetical protein
MPQTVRSTEGGMIRHVLDQGHARKPRGLIANWTKSTEHFDGLQTRVQRGRFLGPEPWVGQSATRNRSPTRLPLQRTPLFPIPRELQSPNAKGTGPCFRPKVSRQEAFSRRKMDQSPDFAALLVSHPPPVVVRFGAGYNAVFVRCQGPAAGRDKIAGPRIVRGAISL